MIPVGYISLTLTFLNQFSLTAFFFARILIEDDYCLADCLTHNSLLLKKTLK